MTTALAESPAVAQVVDLSTNDVEIAELAAQYSALTFDTKEAYDVGTKAIAHLRNLRGQVEAKRQELKEAPLRLCQRIDEAARHFKGKIEAIEDPLKKRKQYADDVAALARRAEEDRLRDEAAAKLKAEQAAEAERLRIENAKLEQHRKEFEEIKRAADADRKAREEADEALRRRIAAEQAAAQKLIDDANAELQRQQAAIRTREVEAARVERERLAKIEADAQTERDRAAAAARAEEDARRLAELAPDLEKLALFAARIRGVAAASPVVESEWARDGLVYIVGRLVSVAGQLEGFRPVGSAEG